MESNGRRRRYSDFQCNGGRRYHGRAPYGGVDAPVPYQQDPDALSRETPVRRDEGSQAYGAGYGEPSQLPAQSVPVGAMPYSPSYIHEAQGGPQYHPYGPSVLYGVTEQQRVQQIPYQAVQQYQPRPAAGMEGLQTQYGVSQQHYYVHTEPAQASSIATVMAPEGSGEFASAYAYTSQSSPTASYQPAGMTDPSQSASHSVPVHQTAHVRRTEEQQQSFRIQPQAQYPLGQVQPDDDHTYDHFFSDLRRTSDYVKDDRLDEAAKLLMSLSLWLVQNVETLVRDDPSLYRARLRLWEKFNETWLMTLERQRQIIQETLDSGRQPFLVRNLIAYEVLETMGRELVQLCDSLENYGLVDYQMGVWEEDIIIALDKCLDLLDLAQSNSQSGGARASSSNVPNILPPPMPPPA